MDEEKRQKIWLTADIPTRKCYYARLLRGNKQTSQKNFCVT